MKTKDHKRGSNMEISKTEASIILSALDRVQVQGLNTQQAVLALARRLNAFVIASEATDGDDVPSSSE